MSPAGGQSGAPDPARWVSVAEAARLTRTDASTWRRKARKEYKLAIRAGRESRTRLGHNADGKRTWFVRVDLHLSLEGRPDPEPREQLESDRLRLRHPSHKVDQACLKRHYVNEWIKRKHAWRTRGQTDLSLAQDVVREARAEHRGFHISAASLKRWEWAYKAEGLPGLIDGRSAGKAKGASRDAAGRDVPAVEHFYKLFRTPNRFTRRQCHEATLDEARRQGWRWPQSYQATTRWMRNYDDEQFTYLCRYGRKRWNHKYLPHVKRDWGAIEPGYCFVSDHCQADFWVSGEGVRLDKKPFRPWLTAVQDGRSRRIVGWHLGASPNQDAILAALRMAFRDCAIPEVLYVDNGKDFNAKIITGLTKAELRLLRKEFGSEWRDVLRRERSRLILDDTRWFGVTGELGIDVRYALPYSPWSKPIERWFKEFHLHCCKSFHTYCGSTSEDRPEDLREILKSGDLPTLAEARERVLRTVELFHARPHRGVGCDGRTPMSVWRSATRLRRAAEGALLFLMDIRGMYKAGPNGVTVTIDGGSIAYGARSPDLRHYLATCGTRREVLIKVDGDRRDYVWALTPERDGHRLIGRLDANEYIHPMADGQSHREAVAQGKRLQAAAQKSGVRVPRKRAVALMNENTTRKHARLRKTGTDDVAPGSNIAPVPTGFERVSRATRTLSEPLCDDPRPWHEQLQDLLPSEKELERVRRLEAHEREIRAREDAEFFGRDYPGTEAATDDAPTSGLEGLL